MRLTQVPIDVVAHVRRLEDVMIRVCRDFGVETVRVEGRSGVWVLADDRGPDRKLGAIGVRVSRRVTMHGFALNCDADLSWADAIIPCGIAGCRRVVADPRGRPSITVQDVLPYAEKHLTDVLADLTRFGARHARRRLERVTVAPEGRRMLRVEARNAQTPIERKPEWIRTTAKMGPEFTQIHAMVKGEGLHTVCQEAGCPNIFECWEDREATFLIGGDTCTRRCDFCDIATGRPQPLDLDEPRRVAESVRSMGLRYSTVTGVARDDQPDGAAGLYAETIRQIHALNPNTGVEILPPDFGAVPELVGQVFDARPEVFAHNLETVPRIFKRIRPAFTYDKSLRVLTMAREAELVTKSNLILGMGEEDHEIEAAIRDLHDAGCDILTITQYLRPSPKHHPIDRWVKPEEFVHWSEVAQDVGFKGVMAGPLVRSSYRAGRLWATAMNRWGRPIPEHLVAPRGGHGRPRPPGGRVVGGPRGAHRILIPSARGIPRALPH